MHCLYCQNRDTWDIGAGQRLCVTDILKEFNQYHQYFDGQHGGITVSGGEPTLQADFVTELFSQCKEEGVHTCLDTNGFIRDHDVQIDQLLAVTDLVLLDLKAMNDTQHINITGVSNRHTLSFAKHLQDIDKPTWVRHVVVPGMTDSHEEMTTLGEFVQPMQNIHRLELIAYHELGKHKWELMGQTYPLENIPPASAQQMTTLREMMQRFHPNVVI